MHRYEKIHMFAEKYYQLYMFEDTKEQNVEKGFQEKYNEVAARIGENDY